MAAIFQQNWVFVSFVIFFNRCKGTHNEYHHQTNSNRTKINNFGSWTIDGLFFVVCLVLFISFCVSAKKRRKEKNNWIVRLKLDKNIGQVDRSHTHTHTKDKQKHWTANLFDVLTLPIQSKNRFIGHGEQWSIETNAYIGQISIEIEISDIVSCKRILKVGAIFSYICQSCIKSKTRPKAIFFYWDTSETQRRNGHNLVLIIRFSCLLLRSLIHLVLDVTNCKMAGNATTIDFATTADKE